MREGLLEIHLEFKEAFSPFYVRCDINEGGIMDHTGGSRGEAVIHIHGGNEESSLPIVRLKLNENAFN